MTTAELLPLFLCDTGHQQYDVLRDRLHVPVRLPERDDAVVMYESTYRVREVCRNAGLPEPHCEIRGGNRGVLVRLGS